MAYRQDGPVPEQVRFTLRVDSETNPALAELLWRMPWGARNSAVVELLELGFRAKYGGTDLPTRLAVQPKPAQRHEGGTVREPGKRTTIPLHDTPVSAIAVATSGLIAPLVPSTPAPSAFPSPHASDREPLDPSIAPPSSDSAEPVGQPEPNDAISHEDEPSAVSLLLGQFGA